VWKEIEERTQKTVSVETVSFTLTVARDPCTSDITALCTATYLLTYLLYRRCRD